MSLTRDDLNDIKQLMEASISANNKVLLESINIRFDEQDEKLDAIMDAVGADLDEHQEQLNDHETRIVRLEKRTV